MSNTNKPIKRAAGTQMMQGNLFQRSAHSSRFTGNIHPIHSPNGGSSVKLHRPFCDVVIFSANSWYELSEPPIVIGGIIFVRNQLQ